ncbi:MAG: hypothetical protein AB7R40_26465 [Nitrospiraceae bacterium]
MKTSEFLAEFADHHFPVIEGPLIAADPYGLGFTASQLREMESRGLIRFEPRRDAFRLTTKAALFRRELQTGVRVWQNGGQTACAACGNDLMLIAHCGVYCPACGTCRDGEYVGEYWPC